MGPSVNQATELTALEVLEQVPDKPGIYAAWVVDESALRQCGIAGPAPSLIYVGKAGERGLRKRLEIHARRPFYELGELLAVRGNALFPWEHRVVQYGPGRFKPGPLCQISSRQTLEWQHRHLMWSWRTVSSKSVTKSENEAIEAGEPILNRQGGGSVPPQLRAASGYSRARSRWLWHVVWAWLDYYDAESPTLSAADATDWQRGQHFRIDRDGYPLPASLWERRERHVALPRSWPSKDSLLRLMRDAARNAEPAVRHAVGQGLGIEELCIWYSAHCAARFLPKPWDLRDALRASLEMAGERASPGPARLPEKELLDRMGRLERHLWRIRH